MCISVIEVLTKTNKSIVYFERFPKHFVCKPHKHNNKETIHISKGCGYIYNGNNLIKLKKGMRFIVQPDTYHNILTKEDTLECYGIIEGDDTIEIQELFYDFMKHYQ